MSRQVSPRQPVTSDRGVGPRIGPVRVTPLRVMATVAVGVGLGLVVWALVRRDEGAVPVLATGTLILGLAFAAIAVGAAVGVYRSAVDEQSGRALALAIGGGLAAILAFGCLASAAVLALLWRATPA